jgi:signal transduction histidine kinase
LLRRASILPEGVARESFSPTAEPSEARGKAEVAANPSSAEPAMVATMTDLAPAAPFGRVRQRWASLTLARQFSLAGSAVLLAGMLVIGLWVTRQIEEDVTRNTAIATALYVDSVIAPLLPDIRGEDTLPEGARRALDETLSQGALGRRLASFKIWKKGGLIAYSSRPELIGRRFEPTDNLKRAWSGQVTAEFDELHDDEDALERAEGLPLLEIYSPIREPWSGEVVAVAEFYEVASEIEDDLFKARLRSWLIVAAVTLGMLGLLSGIVLRGSSLITAQRQDLERRVDDLSRLLRQNEDLRRRVQQASSRAVALNERYLKRISADLHDGPAQLLALASLRMGDARLSCGTPEGDGELGSIRTYLDEAMREIRDICRGLVLPQIEAMELPQLVRAAAAAHEQRTGTSVVLDLPEEGPPLTHSEKICVFRLVQEGLNNAFRHAGGAGQSVTVALENRTLRVVVGDEGGGFDVRKGGEGLGLAGLRERVESLGGTFEVESSPSGTRLTMTLRLAEGESR